MDYLNQKNKKYIYSTGPKMRNKSMTDEECFIFGSHVVAIYRTIPQRENWKIE